MPLNNKILITGTDSGLGKFLHQQIDSSVVINRRNVKKIKLNEDYKIIIHCAFNQKKFLTDRDSYYDYLFDNLLFTEKLLSLNYNLFIYISSIEVYKKNNFDLSIYFKKFAESLVNKKAKRFKILRCSMILGPTMRENHITKIFNNKNSTLSLSKNSEFNYILMEDILSYVQTLKKNEKNELIDFVSSKNIKLEKVVKLFSKKVNYGKFVYKTPRKFKNPIFKNYSYFLKNSETNLRNLYE